MGMPSVPPAVLPTFMLQQVHEQLLGLAALVSLQRAPGRGRVEEEAAAHQRQQRLTTTPR